MAQVLEQRIHIESLIKLGEPTAGFLNIIYAFKEWSKTIHLAIHQASTEETMGEMKAEAI